jgi:glutaredoxin 3
MTKNATNVTVYTTSWCVYCRAVKEYLKGRDVAFREVDVEHDQEAARKLVEKTGQAGVPITEIGDETILGFNRQAIDGALRENKLI